MDSTTRRQATGPKRSWSRRFGSARAPIVAASAALLVAALVLSSLATQMILESRVDERITDGMARDTEEFAALAAGTDPATGELFGPDVERMFRVFLQRNVPSENQVFITYVDGAPYLRSGGDPPARLDRLVELTDRWSAVQAVERGRVQVDDVGVVAYQATPVQVGGDTVGVFVTAWFRDLEASEISDVITVVAIIGGIVLVVAAGIVWFVTGRVLRPVDEVSATARSITETDLTRRIEWEGGRGEIARLVATFNDMLDRLETAFRAQREFIDDAGHELRTPVTIIRGNLDLMNYADDAQREETLELINDELDRMQRMVDDLLLLAKAQQAEFLDVTPVDLDALTDEVLAKARALGDRDWRLDAVAPGVVEGDRQRLTQALLQLAQNAVQHTEPGQRVGVGSALRDGEAHLWVTDDGPGVDPAELDRLFGRFSRGRTSARQDGGAGLGLAIVDAIARAHGGRVEVGASDTGGARFTVVVPAEAHHEATVSPTVEGELP
ncbi:sensor histidine kinase [Phytoactinopolyspora limicola]|uniref:sensor histidine kinase n=1 Tax=Phytoactinopolyspora limicola TaxID=2715536 RepID=UPI001FE35CAA|nr:HAMP domain-containing sensor histidine kinase [Phytoactinopolyspora limicola]